MQAYFLKIYLVLYWDLHFFCEDLDLSLALIITHSVSQMSKISIFNTTCSDLTSYFVYLAVYFRLFKQYVLFQYI